jgi:glutamate dehydrogenase
MSHPQIKALLKKSKTKLTAVQKTFLDAFYKKVPDEDLDFMNVDLIIETAILHEKMSKARIVGTPDIKIHTPRIDNDDWGTGRTIIEIVSDDMPFLVDSVAAEITQNFKLIHLLVHPVLHIERDGKGKFKKVATTASDTSMAESHIHIELQGTLPKPIAATLEKSLQSIISDVYFATKDWHAMRQKLRDCQKGLNAAPAKKYADEQIEEYISFLEYLYRDNFTLLGYRAYRFAEKDGTVKSTIIKNESLGLFHDEMKPVYINEDQQPLPQDLQKMRRDLLPLSVSKVNKRSTVHRPVPLDAIAVKQFDDNGNVTGECLFLGLFTSVTYSRSLQDVPLLRRKAELVMHKSGFKDGSHDYKALRHVLEKYPRDELFQMKTAEISKTCVSIMRLQERQRIALYTRLDPFGRYVSALVYIPRDRYDTRLRLSIQRILEESFGGATVDFYTNLDDSPLARLMFIINIDTKSKKSRHNIKAIEKKLQDAGRLWSEHLSDALLSTTKDEEQTGALIMKYGEAFPVNYRDHYQPKQALFDIEHFEKIQNEGEISLDLYQCNHCEGDEIRLKIFQRGAPVILSDILPVLENMGLRTISEMPFEIKPHESDTSIWIHDFLMIQDNAQTKIDYDGVKPVFETALYKIWNDEVEDDPLNGLVVSTAMDWRDIMIMRCYIRYMRQIGSTFGLEYMAQALLNNASIAELLVTSFKLRHDPALQGTKDHAKQIKKLDDQIIKSLESVDSLDEDRIIRQISNFIHATLRTGFFQPAEDGRLKPYMAVKFDCDKIQNLPKPVPYREIFVYSPRVEGIHLRGDIIARGGLRWSDRHEDFRTEVLGLMKAQQVKNSVIVPMGAKGGFVVKNPPRTGGREAILKEGIECYKRFVGALLEITDNRSGTKVIPPNCVVRHDGDDPYLVVAADKGTAKFSDIANKLSEDHGFWLGDAFASGGSAGYDHKEMGITARGAWESVKRHFRELNHDTQSKDFEVIGVGDMAGDVFGNGMLLSEHIKLVGAFNHMHIFCDPDPDTAKTFKERQRLFKAVKGWDSYDQSLLSKGGRIFERSEKSLRLTPEIRKRFDIEDEKVTPYELMNAMLKARTDLMWFGGIGTYIKAATESHQDVGDKANDIIRINGAQLRAKVVGEGANLAVTQAGRIEFDQKGGRINADFLDNSGGVDSSDHEVNIKILFSEIMNDNAHKMTRSKRDKILENMTGEVAALVLRNSYQQVQGISLMEMDAVKNLGDHANFIDDLEKKYGIDRAIEGLPSDEEIEARRAAGRGLTRPELGIIQAYAKIHFSKSLVDTAIPDLPEMQDYWLLAYFPTPLRKKFRKDILSHRLRREIIATTMASSLVNRMGPVFVNKIQEKTGASSAAIARAYIDVREAFNMRELWDSIESLDGTVPAEAQLKAMRDAVRVIERETIWTIMKNPAEEGLGDVRADYAKSVRTLQDKLETLVPQTLQETIRNRKKAAIDNKFPENVAAMIARAPKMGASFDIVRLSLECKHDLELTASLYFAVGDVFRLEWFRRQARGIETVSPWATQALRSLMDQLYDAQVGITRAILMDTAKSKKKSKATAAPQSKTKSDDAKVVIESWADDNHDKYLTIHELLEDMKHTGTIDMPMLIVAAQRLRGLYET